LAAAGLATPVLALGGPATWLGDGGRHTSTVMVHGGRGNICTGTLVARGVVLTAAHCLHRSPRVAVSYLENGSRILQEAASWKLHPGYKPGRTQTPDLALIRLRVEAPARFGVAALAGAQVPSEVGTPLTTVGYGLAVGGDPTSAGTLRMAEVEVLPKPHPIYMRIGSRAGGLRFCQGDSGGPLFGRGEAAPVVAVLNAAGKDADACGAEGYAVRLAPHRAWLDQVLRSWGE
jgi:hypothetical protein